MENEPMAISDLIMKMANPICRAMGLEMVRASATRDSFVPMGGMSQKEIVGRFRWMKDHLKFDPRAVVDIGASDGRWTEPFLEAFPEARVLMVEPLEEHAQKLTRLTQEHPGLRYQCALLGESERMVEFNRYGHKSSVLGNSRGERFGDVKQQKMTTLDTIMETLQFPAPDLLKLDVEGAEILVLKGGAKALASAEVVELEVSLLPFKKDLPLFDEVVTFMSASGFRVFDCFGILGRPTDGMPVQGECIFIRKQSKLISDYRWADGLSWS